MLGGDKGGEGDKTPIIIMYFIRARRARAVVMLICYFGAMCGERFFTFLFCTNASECGTR